MEKIEKVLDGWNSSLCQKIELGALYSRNPTAHKWKATYRSNVLRELTLWRLTDLLSQAVYLGKAGHILGARILLRSAIETLGILIYLNQKTEAILEGKIKFDHFSKLTSRLMLGSKDCSTKLESVNILTVLEKCNKKYPGIFALYKVLSESAHPNYEGVCSGYSYVNEQDYETIFENLWKKKFGNTLEEPILLCLYTFEDEYSNVWLELFERLEKWIEANDDTLEVEKTGI